MSRRVRVGLAAAAALALLTLLSPSGGSGPTVRVVVPSGAGLAEVTDSLVARDVIRAPTFFRLYARVLRADRRLKAGAYDLPTPSSWHATLRRLTRGEVATVPLTIPEGFSLTQMAPRIAAVSGEPIDAVTETLHAPGADERLGVPGPGLEGYLFPDTYRFAHGVRTASIVEAMTRRYHEVWTPERRARLAELGSSEREVVTLASIVQAEARRVDEMPRIAGVYHNRLAAGWLLQADPTVLYALGGYRERLLYAAIDSVEDSPYNTYAKPGLPPGPIGAPGALAIDAVLTPERHDYMYFVAAPDGSHVFTRSLAEHNAARADVVRARESGRSGS